MSGGAEGCSVIPAVAHFIWLGRELPWLHVAALRSAARRGGFERVVLHHDEDLSSARYFRELVAIPKVETRRLQPRQLLSALAKGGAQLWALYERLKQPAARSNLLRLAILAGEGGVYLDLDTVTLRSYDELRRNHDAFCGLERLAFPAQVTPLGTPFRFAVALLKSALRDGLRRLPNGHRWMRRVERLYPLAANNAVLGCAPGHALALLLLEDMLRLSPRRQAERYALGTSLLQERLRVAPLPDLELLAPEVFYPLGPELSTAWFRLRRRAELDDVLSARTLTVHWYASVRTRAWVPRIDAAWVRAHAQRQWLSRLLLPFAD